MITCNKAVSDLLFSLETQSKPQSDLTPNPGKRPLEDKSVRELNIKTPLLRAGGEGVRER